MDSPLFKSLQQKVDPGHTALIVVDVLNDFIADGGWFDKCGKRLVEMQQMVPRLIDFIAEARAHGVRVIFIRNNYDDVFLTPNMKERTLRKQYGSAPCQPGTWGADFYKVQPQPQDLIVTKHRYNAFHGTDLDVILRANGIHTVLMTGVTTECCVESASRDAYFKGYYVVLVSDCCGTYDPALQQGTERNIDELFGVVVTSTDVRNTWSPVSSATAGATRSQAPQPQRVRS